MKKLSTLANQVPHAVCMFCGYVMPRCECPRCELCGSRRHEASTCPEKPGDAIHLPIRRVA